MDEVRHLNDDELRALWTQRFTALSAEGDEEKRITSLVSPCGRCSRSSRMSAAG